MISFNAIWLFSLVGIAAIALILLVMTMLNSSLRGKDFSLLNNFPFEFLKINSGIAYTYKILMFILTGLAFSPLFVITPLIAEFGDLGFLSILITCVFGLTAIANCLLFFFDARFTKSHMVLVTVAMSLTFLSNTLATLLSILVYKTYLDMSDSHPISLVLAIVSGLIAIGTLALILNPKLNNWAKLKIETSPNGEKIVTRPKVFILALSEWIIIFLGVIGELIFLLSLIK